MERSHTFFAPSASKRWMDCTASLVVDTSGIEQSSNVYADRGTKLHAIAESMLRQGTNFAPVSLCDDDQASIQAYVDYVRSLSGLKFFEVSSLFLPDCGGISDCVSIRPGLLEIVDYKSGSGFVDPVENTQLIIYALGIVRKYGDVHEFKRILLTVVQPAVSEKPMSWGLALAQLERWGKRVATSIKKVKDGDVVFRPGEDNCRYCPAKTICPSLEEHVQDSARDDFKHVDKLAWEEKLKLVPILRTWCTGIEVEANRLLLSGERVPGFKVVRGRRNRSWDGEAGKKGIVALLTKWKFGERDIYTDPKLVSPAGAEALIKGRGRKAKLLEIAEFVDASPGPPTVVPESDGRKELTKRELAKDDFKEVIEGDASEPDPLS